MLLFEKQKIIILSSADFLDDSIMDTYVNRVMVRKYNLIASISYEHDFLTNNWNVVCSFIKNRFTSQRGNTQLENLISILETETNMTGKQFKSWINADMQEHRDTIDYEIGTINAMEYYFD